MENGSKMEIENEIIDVFEIAIHKYIEKTNEKIRTISVEYRNQYIDEQIKLIKECEQQTIEQIKNLSYINLFGIIPVNITFKKQ